MESLGLPITIDDNWFWLGTGLLLMFLELAAPGAFLLWFGAAAFLLGLTLSFIPFEFGWQWQLLLFGLLSILTLYGGRKYFSRSSKDEGDPHLNVRGSRYVGRSFILDEAIVMGRGSLRIDDTVWRIEGPDLPAGSKVVVSEVSSTVLQVQAANEEVPS
ncbi:NfeD family protein [Polycladidibacter stylochi]|uniref:NfeD family protein n=1 Tax=Polycladidibacter stylochi TaxID=1807766 RepID=UPI00082A41A5|nr:NfeD family protein [Pseudovibrio stylochi]